MFLRLHKNDISKFLDIVVRFVQSKENKEAWGTDSACQGGGQPQYSQTLTLVVSGRLRAADSISHYWPRLVLRGRQYQSQLFSIALTVTQIVLVRETSRCPAGQDCGGKVHFASKQFRVFIIGAHSQHADLFLCEYKINKNTRERKKGFYGEDLQY